MEDFFQILIFVVYIIIMIISAKNKKKKKQQKQKVAFPASTKSKTTNLPEVSKQKSQQEIFEELFGIKPKQNKTAEQKAVTPEPSYKTWYAEDDFKPKKHNDNYSFRNKDKFEKEEFEEESLEHDVFYVRKKNKFKEKVEKTKEQLEKERLAHKAIKETNFKNKKTTQNRYQKLFDNPSTLKDYIVISEILNKPKALRR